MSKIDLGIFLQSFDPIYLFMEVHIFVYILISLKNILQTNTFWLFSKKKTFQVFARSKRSAASDPCGQGKRRGAKTRKAFFE